MTIPRRFRCALAACALLPVLPAGCTNSSQFTAGRLPYGGSRVASAEASPQDPFLAQAGTNRPYDPATNRPAESASLAQGGQASPQGWVPQQQTAQQGMSRSGFEPHQTAYLPQDENPFAQSPFAQVSADTGPQASEQAQWASFETPADSAEPNPFAEIEGQPPVAGRTAQGTARTEPMPRITPGVRPSPPRQSSAQTTSYASEEFLPPIQ